jgi:hypothetical protein
MDEQPPIKEGGDGGGAEDDPKRGAGDHGWHRRDL